MSKGDVKMRHGTKSIVGIISIIFAMAIAAMVGFAVLDVEVHAAETVETNVITSATLSKDLTSLEVKAKLTSETLDAKPDGIYLFEIMPYQSASQIGQLTPLAQEKASSDITFKVNFDAKNRPRLFAKLVIATKSGGNYTIIAPARYIDNIDAAAENRYDYPTAVSKKGLQIQMVADAQELGVSHTVINVPVNEYLHAEKQADSESYVYYNQTYYFDRNMVSYLDHRVKVLTEANINVYLNILLTAPTADMSLKLRSLYYDNVSDMAQFYAFNMQNQDSVMYLEAFLTFLAERYTREDAEYGFAGSFIMGYEVNSNRNSNSMGALNMDAYLNSYIAAFRVADTALRSIYSNGRVYLSLANNFNREAGTEQISTDPMVDYAAKSFLDAFNQKVSYAGNIPWKVAINPYTSDPSNTSFWNDAMATDSSDTPYITMKNIDVLCDYLKQEAFLYNGKTRGILISEFGVSADPNSGMTTTQSAAIAYSYYKAVANSDIEAIIYHRHVDHDVEASAGLWYGLWTHAAGSDITPQAKKAAYTTFKYMDTADNVSKTTSALKLLGANTWDDLIPGFKETMAQSRTLYEGVAYTGDIGRGFSERLLCEFSDGDLFNFYPSDNTNVVELRADTAVSGDSKMYAAATCTNPHEYMGVSSIFTTPLNVKNTHYITLKLKSDAPSGANNIGVMVRLYSGGNTYEGIGQINEGVWSILTFDITELTEKVDTIDGLKLWIKPYEGSGAIGGEYSLWLDNITLSDKGGFTFGTFLITLLVIVLLGGAAIVIYFTLQNRATKAKKPMPRPAGAPMYGQGQMPPRQMPNGQQTMQRPPQQGQRPPMQGQRPMNGQPMQNQRLGTLSSDEEFRAAYGGRPMNQGQPQQRPPMQNPQNPQYGQRPMQGSPQQRPMGQPTYRNGQPIPPRPMNGQGQYGQRPPMNQAQRPMNQGQPQRPPQSAQPSQTQQFTRQTPTVKSDASSDSTEN